MTKKITYKYNADYSARSFFPFYDVEKLYNAFLIPENLKEKFQYLDIGNEITVEYNNIKSKYTIAYKLEDIIINTKNYLLFYIGRGINLPQIANYSLVFKDEKIALDTTFNLFNNNPKLFMGILVMSGLYNFAVSDNDDLILKVDDDEFIELKASNISFSHNVFSPMRTSTMIFLDIQKSLRGLFQLHQPPYPSTLSIRSLTTKRIKQKGTLRLLCAGGPYLLHLISEDNNYNKKIQFTDIINIMDLDYGLYKFSILDINTNEIIEMLSDGLTYNEIEFRILDSIESERIIIMNKFNALGTSSSLPRI